MLTRDVPRPMRLAMAGVNIAAFRDAAIRKTLGKLRGYLQHCTSRGYLAESAFLSDVIENIRRDCADMAARQAMDAEEAAVTADLTTVKADFRSTEHKWDNRLAELEVERELALNDLELKKQGAMMELERKWNSGKMKAKFNKPSARLVELRRCAQTLLKTLRFDEAATVTEEIDHLEQSEADEAAFQMNLAYSVALKRLEARFANDLDSLESSFHTKRNQLEREKAKTILPIARRVDKAENRKKDLLDAQRKMPRTELANSPPRQDVRGQTTVSLTGKKLDLPDVTGVRSSLVRRTGRHAKRRNDD
jgi:hypothetical protein